VAEGQDRAHIDRVLRTLATASRSLRLYPAASPIPRQSVGAVESALEEVFAEEAGTLTLAVARDGFECEGLPVAINVPGGEELAAEFRVRGVSELHFENGAQADDILKMILLLAKSAEEVRASGGFAAGLAAEGGAHRRSRFCSPSSTPLGDRHPRRWHRGIGRIRRRPRRTHRRSGQAQHLASQAAAAIAPTCRPDSSRSSKRSA
jgi:hypothetical protein